MLHTFSFLPHDFTTKTICITISMIMAVSMYIPLFRRIKRRHHTRDFSKTFQWLNLAVQINNGVLAIAEHAPFLIAWYVVQTTFCAVMLYLVYKYWDYPDPRH